jgi:hypothetical protein
VKNWWLIVPFLRMSVCQSSLEHVVHVSTCCRVPTTIVIVNHRSSPNSKNDTHRITLTRAILLALLY